MAYANASSVLAYTSPRGPSTSSGAASPEEKEAARARTAARARGALETERGAAPTDDATRARASARDVAATAARAAAGLTTALALDIFSHWRRPADATESLTCATRASDAV